MEKESVANANVSFLYGSTSPFLLTWGKVLLSGKLCFWQLKAPFYSQRIGKNILKLPGIAATAG